MRNEEENNEKRNKKMRFEKIKVRSKQYKLLVEQRGWFCPFSRVKLGSEDQTELGIRKEVREVMVRELAIKNYFSKSKIYCNISRLVKGESSKKRRETDKW